MKDLVIGDVHFGVRSNSITWLEHQIKLFKNQIYSSISTEKPDRVIFLGDVFDIRNATNAFIGITVKNMFRDMLTKFNAQFYIVAGNHDYYSPSINFEKYNTYELVFGREFISKYDNLHVISEDYFIDEDNTAFLPWYWTEDEDRWKMFVHNNKQVKVIYCHSDLNEWTTEKIISKGNAVVYAGHIHYTWSNRQYGLYNVGACCQLTFNDANSPRHYYIIEDGVITKAIKNVTTPKFIRLYNDDIFDFDESIFDNSFVQICISSSNINKAKYIEQITYIKSTYYESNIKINVIDDAELDEMRHIDASDSFMVNIATYIERNIPDYLRPKYNLVKDKLKNK